jgi:hypothetical protein
MVERSAMLALRPRHWNVVLITVLIAGSLFIAATRVQPGSGTRSPAAQTDVLTDPAPLPAIWRPILRCRSSMGHRSRYMISVGRSC